MARELNLRQRKFADAYLLSGNATQAAIAAGYSEKAARTNGPELLQNTRVAAYLAAKQQRIEQKTEALQDQILEELKRLAFSNAQDYMRLDADGNPVVDLSRATRDQLAAVTKFGTKKRSTYHRGELVGEETNVSVSTADKYRGLELLGRHIGMFKQEEQRVVVDVADRLLKARTRVLSVTRVEDAESSEAE